MTLRSNVAVNNLKPVMKPRNKRFINCLGCVRLSGNGNLNKDMVKATEIRRLINLSAYDLIFK